MKLAVRTDNASRRRAPPPPELPRIPGYEALEFLGQGGMAQIWLALEHGADQPCVLKIPRWQAVENEGQRRRFIREARVTQLLRHPSIARTYDAQVMGDTMYMAMEFIAGCDLRSLAARWLDRQVPLNITAAVGLRVLEALIYAHEYTDADGQHLALVHRDLTPTNVMVTFDGRVKLIDFGLVRTCEGQLTEPGMIAGTARYMAPEQAVGEQVDVRSDLYALAAVLYEMLTGRPAAPGRTVAEVLEAVVDKDPPAPSTINPYLPPELDMVFLTALQKNPEDRYPTARTFRYALQRALQQVEVADSLAVADMVRELFAEEYEQARRRQALVIDELCDPSEAPTVAMNAAVLIPIPKSEILVAPTVKSPAVSAQLAETPTVSVRTPLVVHVGGG